MAAAFDTRKAATRHRGEADLDGRQAGDGGALAATADLGKLETALRAGIAAPAATKPP